MAAAVAAGSIKACARPRAHEVVCHINTLIAAPPRGQTSTNNTSTVCKPYSINQSPVCSTVNYYTSIIFIRMCQNNNFCFDTLRNYQIIIHQLFLPFWPFFGQWFEMAMHCWCQQFRMDKPTFVSVFEWYSIVINMIITLNLTWWYVYGSTLY